MGRSTGFVALMQLLKTKLLHNQGLVNDCRRRRRWFTEALSRIQLTDDELTKERFLPGSSGRAKFYRELESAAIPSLKP